MIRRQRTPGARIARTSKRKRTRHEDRERDVIHHTPSVSVAGSDEGLDVIVADPVMINSVKSGILGNGRPFPDGKR